MGYLTRDAVQISVFMPVLLLCAPAEQPGSVAVMAVDVMEELKSRGVDLRSIRYSASSHSSYAESPVFTG